MGLVRSSIQNAFSQWRLVFVGEIPPFGECYPHELFGDAQILNVCETLVARGFYVDVYNNPLLGIESRLKKRYPEYFSLADKNERFRFLQGKFPKQINQEISGHHFGLMLYEFEGVKVGELHFKHIAPSKFYHYIEAGIPVLVIDDFKSVCEIVEKFGIGICISKEDFDILPSILKGCDYEKLRKNVIEARDELSMHNQIERLIKLYQS